MANKTNKPGCASCKFFEPYPTKQPVEGGECRKNPPVIGGSGSSEFPATFYGDWCGAWKKFKA